MSQIRRGVTQASYNESMSGFFMLQVFCIAVALGIYYESWWVFGGTLLGLIFGVSTSAFIGAILAIGLGIGWGYVTYHIMDTFGAGSDATWVVTILVTLGTMGANFAGVEWTQDVAGYDPTPAPQPRQKTARSVPRQVSSPPKKSKKRHKQAQKSASSGGFGGFAQKEKAIINKTRPDTAKSASSTTQAPKKSPDEIAKLDALWKERDCPRCAETIKAKAKYCRFCEYNLEGVDAYLGMRTVLETHAQNTGMHAAELLPQVSAIEAIAAKDNVDLATAAQQWVDANTPAPEKPQTTAKKKAKKKAPKKKRVKAPPPEPQATAANELQEAPKEDVVQTLSKKSSLFQSDLLGLSRRQLRQLAKARSMSHVSDNMDKGDMILAMAEDAESWG
jgi:hypothetical protein